MITENKPNYNICFQSRNIEVRKVDNIMRKIHNEFPVYSNTALNRFKTRKKQQILEKFIIQLAN